MYAAQWFPPTAKNVPHLLHAQHVSTNPSFDAADDTSAPDSCAAILPACSAAAAVEGAGERSVASSLGRRTIGSTPVVESQTRQEPSADTDANALGNIGCQSK
jgi:hypothetical protein